MKKNLLLATLLVSAAFGLGATNRAMAGTTYTIDGSADYLSGAADGTLGASQLTVDGTTPITGTWNATNEDIINMSGGTLSISKYTGADDDNTNGVLNATGGVITISEDTLFAIDGSSIGGTTQLINNGTIQCTTPTAMALDKLTNSGSINIGTAELTLNALGAVDTSVNSGLITAETVNIGANHTLETAGAGLDATYVNLAAGAVLKLTGGDLAATIGNFGEASFGDLSVTDNATYTGEAHVANLSVAAGKTFKVNESGYIYVNNNLSNNGTTTLEHNAVLQLRKEGGVENAGTINGTDAEHAGALQIGDGTLTLAETVLTNTGLIKDVAVVINSDGKLITSGYNGTNAGLNSAVTNAGTLQLTGGTVAQNVNSLTALNGTTILSGDVSVAGSKGIFADTLNIGANTLTLGAGSEAAAKHFTVLDGALITDGENAAILAIGDNGVNNDITNATINVDKIYMYGNVAADASKITSSATDGIFVEDGAVVTLTGATNANKFRTDDAYTAGVIIAQTMANTGVIAVDNLTINAKDAGDNDIVFTTAANLLQTSNAVVNNGTLQLTGGTSSSYSALGAAISGSGETEIGDGTNAAYVSNAKEIAKAVTVNSAGHFNNLAGGSTGALTVEANGEAILSGGTVGNGLAGGVINKGTFTFAGGSIAEDKYYSQTATGTTKFDSSVTSMTLDEHYLLGGGSIIIGDGIDGHALQTITSEMYMFGPNVTKTINENGKLIVADGDTILDTDDTWAGQVELNDGGRLTLAGLTGANAIVTDDTIKYTQDGGSLQLGNSSLTLNEGSAITGGSVKLGNADPASTGTLILNNGLDTNTAVLTTNGESALTIIGGSGFTTMAETNIGSDAVVTLGDADTTGTLNVAAGSVTLGANDNWTSKGTVNVTAGTLTLAGVEQNGVFSQTGGILNISGDQTLGTGAEITSATQVNILADNTLTLDDGSSLSLDGGASLDNVSWAGDIVLDGGSLTLANIVDQSRADEYNKTGVLTANTGNLTINASNVLLGNGDTIADAVNLTLLADITLAEGSSLYVTGDEWSTGNITLAGGTLGLNGITTSDTKALAANTGALNFTGDASTLAGANDLIAKAVVVNVGSDLTINNAAASVTLNGDVTDPVSADTWTNKAITLTSGNLTFDSLTIETDENLKYNQEGGYLKLDGTSLTLNAGSAITGGTVEIDPSPLVFNNGVANSAKILMTVDDGSSVTIKGLDADNTTTLTLEENSNLQYGSLTVGDATNANVLNVTENSQIAQAVAVDLKANSTLNLNLAGDTSKTAKLTMDAGDSWKGLINQVGGTLTIRGEVDETKKTGALISNGGSLVLGDDVDENNFGSLTLANEDDSVAKGTVVVINENGVLEILDGSVVLDNDNNLHTADTWEGAISLGNAENSGSGTLTLDSRYDADLGTTDDVKIYNQFGGTLNMNHSTLVLDTDDSGIFGGTVNLNSISTLTFNNGSTQNMAEIKSLGEGINKLTLANTDGLGLTLVGQSLLAAKDQVSIGEGSTLTIAGTSGATPKQSVVYLNEGEGNDTWGGSVVVTSQGVLNISDNLTKTGTLTQTNGGITNIVDNFTITTGDNITAGQLNIGDGATDTILTMTGSANIGKDTAVTIAAAAELAMEGGTATLNANDTWTGAVSQEGGTLTLSNRTDTTTETKTYNSIGGTLNIIDGASLALATDESAITGGVNSVVNLGDNLTVGSLIISNGLDTNSAVVVTNGASTFQVSDAEGNKFTTATGTNIAKDAILKVLGSGELNVAAGTVDVSDNDTWSGTIDLTADGTLNIYDDLAKTGVLNATGGNLNIGYVDGVDETKNIPGTLNLNNVNDVIGAGVVFTIEENGILNQTNGNVTLGADDTWSGAIALAENGTLTITGRGMDTTDDTQTYNQTGGTLNLNDSTLFLATADSSITDGTVNLTNAAGLVVDNGLDTNSAEVITGDDSLNELIVGNANDTTLTLTDSSTINTDASVTVRDGSSLVIASTAAGGVNLNGGDGADADTWSGNVDVQGGILNISGDLGKTGTLTQTTGDGTTNITGNFTMNVEGDTVSAGTLNIGDGATETTLTVGTGDVNTPAIWAGDGHADVTIAQNATLNIDENGYVVLDGGADLSMVDWQGTVELNGGTLVLANIVDVTRVEGAEPYNKTGNLDAETGTLYIDNTTVLLGAQDVIAEAVDLHLTGDIIVDADSTVTVDNTDSWDSGTISLDDDGSLTLIGVETGENTNIDVVDGNLTLTNGDDGGESVSVTLGNANDNIEYLAHVDLNGDLVIDDGNVELNGTAYVDDTDIDSLVGSITQNGGTLSLLGVETSDDLEIAINGGETVLDNMTFGNDNDFVGYDAKITVNNGLTINAGQVQLNGSDYDNPEILIEEPNDVDTLSDGVVITLGGGQLDLMDISTVAADADADPDPIVGVYLDANTGSLTINNGVNGLGVELNNENDDIASAVAVTVNGNLTINDGIVRLNGEGEGQDTLAQGTIELDGGQLDLTSIATVAHVDAGEDPEVPGVNLVAETGDLNLYGVTLNNALDEIDYTATVLVDGNLTINDGLVQLNGTAYHGEDGNIDTLTSGTISLAGGELDLQAIETNDNVSLVATSGNLIIDADEVATSLLNAADSIAETVIVNLKEGATLTIDNEGEDNLVVLNKVGSEYDDADIWAGALNLADGNLEIKESTVVTTETATYTQTGGEMTLTDTALTLATADSYIDGEDAVVNINGGAADDAPGSQLTFDNGRNSNLDPSVVNQAIIKSDDNENNSLTIGGENENDTELTLLSGSDINGNTAVTIAANGILNVSGDSIKGEGDEQYITNDGIFNLTNDDETVGTIARAINNADEDGSTGTVNLTGNTMSTAGSTIDQAFVNVGEDGADIDHPSVFVMGDDVTVTDTLTVYDFAGIGNAESEIDANNLVVEQNGIIMGYGEDEEHYTEGNITIGGGSNAGIITQDEVTLLAADADRGNTGIFDNSGVDDEHPAALTANGYFQNDAQVTDSNGAGILNIYGGGESNNEITQSIVQVAGDVPFDNNDVITATSQFNNYGTTNNNDEIYVRNDDGDALLTNGGVINANSGSEIHANTMANHVEPENPDDPTIEGTINMKNAKLAVYYQADDIEGVINVLENADGDDNSELAIASADPDAPAAFVGDLNVGGGENGDAELEFTSGIIGEAADVSIASGSVLTVDDTNSILDNIIDYEPVVESQTPTLTLDGNGGDDYSGDLVLVSGEVTLKDMNEENDSALYVGADSTTDDGQNPYFEQTGGTLNLVNTEMTMEDSSLIADAGAGSDTVLNIDGNSIFNSESGAFIVDDLQNAGLINGINETYEDYTANENLIAGDGAGDNQGDFQIDIYARSNNNSENDTFGSDNALITAANGEDGVLNISDFTLNGDLFGFDAPIDGKINLGQVFKGRVDENVDMQFTATDKQVLTPIGWYGLTSTGAGNYSFDLKRFNPAVFRGQVSKMAQYQNQLAIDDMLFNHTMLDQGFKGNDYIASNPNRYASANDLYAPYYQYSRKDGGLWVKMYGTFEKLNMNHGLHVGNNSYGTIVGADFGLKDLRHGWQFMPTAYIAYNGAHQYWDGNGAYQNGAQLGAMGTWYKDNFMIGALAFGGVYNNDMSTPRGSDDTFNYFAGGSVKAAYNWRFAKDWSLQPNLLVAYSFFGQENWHTNFGQMGMMSGMLNGVNVAPGLNLIWEKETFSTYATIQYMYNVNQSVGGKAGNVYLPHVHMDRGYLQYGIGVNKTFTDRFSGYFQTVIRNVGRTGIGLQLGFNWQLGKGGSNNNMRGYTPELKKTAIKLNGNRY